MFDGSLLVCYPRHWMLVEVLTAFVPFHRLLHGACGLLPERHLSYVGSITACIRISLIELIIMVGDETSPYSQVYAIGYAGFSVSQAMSVPAFGATMRAMFIQKVEAPEGVGWLLGSLPSWFGGAASPVS
jgi:hypothetical protein